MSKTSGRLLSLCLIALGTLPPPLHAEAPPVDVAAAVGARDAAFWKAYNTCDVAGMGDFFTEDVEFYHDRGGMTVGRAALVGTIRDNLCSKPDWRLRREVVEGSVRVFPLQKDDVTYGAVFSGEHVFYIVENGQPGRLDGHARFTHLWRLEDGTWKMSRVLSYDHGPAQR
jgi:uncharacterized protein DUF4440